jgi:hypothetical protein
VLTSTTNRSLQLKIRNIGALSMKMPRPAGDFSDRRG